MPKHPLYCDNLIICEKAEKATTILWLLCKSPSKLVQSFQRYAQTGRQSKNIICCIYMPYMRLVKSGCLMLKTDINFIYCYRSS